MQPLPQKPLVLAMVLCDQFYKERASGNLSLLGCFNSLGSRAFPVRHVELGVYLAITDCAGPMTVQVRVIDEDEVRAPLVTGEATVQVPDPRRVQDFVMNFREVVFPSPGEYRVQAFCNGEFLIERRLHVRLQG